MAATAFLFSPFSSLFLLSLSSLTFLFILLLVSGEFLGHPLRYSKFWTPNSKPHLPSRSAMLLCYLPAFSLFLVPHHFLLSSRIFLNHFPPPLPFLQTHLRGPVRSQIQQQNGSHRRHCDLPFLPSLHRHHDLRSDIALDLAEPEIDLKEAGLAMYGIGITGNFYHHVLLSRLRSGGREYRIPRGGLFKVIVCPHYLFEIVEFLGIAFVSQTLFAVVFVVGSALFLIGRSYATRKWYLSKFEDFPSHIKAILPFVF